MADTSLQSQTEAQEAVYQSAVPVESLEQSLNKLAKFGSFDFLEAVIDGVQSLNPERKARKNIFLTDSSKKKDRETLKQKLALWRDLLQSSDSVSEMADACTQKGSEAAVSLKKNLKKA